MRLILTRKSSDNESTLGELHIGSDFQCYTVEDEYRPQKKMHETRIPQGEYALQLRTIGGFHTKYAARYGAWHKGMLWLQDVPGFEFILIHIGNTDDDSSGCIIVGEQRIRNAKGGGTVARSEVAYKKLYPKVRDAILRGEDVRISIQDFDR